MARITVEDCLDKVDNRFDLVMLASKRARQLATGGRDPLVQVDSDKVTVIALREIAEGLISNANIDVRVSTIFEEDEESEEGEEELQLAAGEEGVVSSDDSTPEVAEASGATSLETGSSEEE